MAFPFPLLYSLAQAMLVVAIALVIVDIVLVYSIKDGIKTARVLPKVFSLSDPNPVKIELENTTNQALAIEVIDEIPIQFQKRDFDYQLKLAGGEEQTINYELTPLTRGEYEFGAVNVFASSILGFVQKKFAGAAKESIAVYPSIIQMKKYELRAIDQLTVTKGIKKIRRIGHSYEFEQIKNYVAGDDYRSINWKATGRRNGLMVNQFQDERSQQVYCVIDKSRVMKMPFEGLSLMDYAINTSLVISNVALQKQDKAGLLTFSDKIGAALKAERKPTQLNKILTALYNEQEQPREANYELLYHASRKLVRGRSLFMLFTNFESMFALDRVLPILRRINALHLLVVVFFENTEIKEYTQASVTTVEDIYTQTVAQKFLAEKTAMVQKLRQYGIQAILTSPEDLSINSINKYLELKARGLI